MKLIKKIIPIHYLLGQAPTGVAMRNVAMKKAKVKVRSGEMKLNARFAIATPVGT